MINQILLLGNHQSHHQCAHNNWKENAAMEIPPVNGKENTKSIKAKEVILAGQSIISGVNGKGLSTDKFVTVVRDIPSVR